MKCERAVLGEVLVETAKSQVRDSDGNAQGFELLSDHSLRHTPTHVLHQKSHTAFVREREVVETHSILYFKGPQCADLGSETFALDGTTINFSLFSWAVRPPGQDSRNQVRKARMSLTPIIKMGVLL